MGICVELSSHHDTKGEVARKALGEVNPDTKEPTETPEGIKTF